MKYLAHDGTVFDTEHECLEHEKKLDAHAAEERGALNELKSFEAKFKESEKEFAGALTRYYKKYGYIPATIPTSGLTLAVIKSIFPWM